MSVSRSCFFLMVGLSRGSGIEFSFIESLHMQLREDKWVWVSEEAFGFKTGFFPLYCKKQETAFDDAFVIAAAWAESMISKDDSFHKQLVEEYKNHPRRERNPFTKEIYSKAGEILRGLTPPLKFLAVSLDGMDYAGKPFLLKAKEYGIHFEFCSPSEKNIGGNIAL